MKLYDFTQAPNPQIVRIFMAEKGIEMELEQVDLMTKAQFDPAFVAKNPMCDVPMLELDDGTCISQTAAVCYTLEALYPETPLLGETPAQKGQVAMWHHICFNNGLYAVAEAFRNSTPGFKGHALAGQKGYEQLQQLVERGTQRTRDFWEFLDQRLADNEYVAGDFFSLADITAYCTVGFGRWIKEYVPEECTNVQRWLNQIKDRPSMGA